MVEIYYVYLRYGRKKYTEKEYKFICSLLCGGVPIDRNWYEGTSIFKTEASKILAKYPELDKSFFEEYKREWFKRYLERLKLRIKKIIDLGNFI